MKPTPSAEPVWGPFDQLEVSYDRELKALWYHLTPHARPCFNRELLTELSHFQAQIMRVNGGNSGDSSRDANHLPVRYTVIASRTPGVFNLGGDLQLFARLIRARDKDGLFAYAKSCIDVLYPNAINFDLPLTTISLVQGDALGGGMEAAISSNVLIAERSAKFGLPEVLFNLIPGMGAYSFLVRKTSPSIAQRIIMSGELLTAEEMYDLGLVDVLAEDGEGEEATLKYIQRHRKRGNSHMAMNRIRRCVNPITYEELIAITTVWVDAALHLTDRDLRMIERSVQAQNRRANLPSTDISTTAPLTGKTMEGQG